MHDVCTELDGTEYEVAATAGRALSYQLFWDFNFLSVTTTMFGVQYTKRLRMLVLSLQDHLLLFPASEIYTQLGFLRQEGVEGKDKKYQPNCWRS